MSPQHLSEVPRQKSSLWANLANLQGMYIASESLTSENSFQN